MNISSVWWPRDDEREQDQNSGGATTDRVIILAVFVLMGVTVVVVGELLDAVIHDNVDSASGSEVAMMDDVDHPDNANE